MPRYAQYVGHDGPRHALLYTQGDTQKVPRGRQVHPQGCAVAKVGNLVIHGPTKSRHVLES